MQHELTTSPRLGSGCCFETPAVNEFKPATTASHCAAPRLSTVLCSMTPPRPARRIPRCFATCGTDADRFLTNCEFLRSIPLNCPQDEVVGCEKYLYGPSLKKQCSKTFFLQATGGVPMGIEDRTQEIWKMWRKIFSLFTSSLHLLPVPLSIRYSEGLHPCRE